MNEQPSPLGRGWAASGVFTSRRGPGEGVVSVSAAELRASRLAQATSAAEDSKNNCRPQCGPFHRGSCIPL